MSKPLTAKVLIAAEPKIIMEDKKRIYLFDGSTVKTMDYPNWNLCNLQSVPVPYRDKMFYAINHVGSSYYILDLLNFTIEEVN